MQATLEELQHTLDEAEAYFQLPDKSVSYVKFHIKNLEEDIELLAATDLLEQGLANPALELRLKARRFKRIMERWLLQTSSELSQSSQVEAQLPRDPSVKPKNAKLQKIKVPIFDGDPTKFIIFWNVLVENVINNDEMTDTAKWVHLKQSLAGQAAELLSEIPQTPEMIQVALKMLQDIYGGEERTIQELYQRFHVLPAATNDVQSIRMTHSKLEGILLSLANLQHSVDENQYIRSVYIGKFPTAIIQEVVKSRTTSFKEIRENISQLLLARESTIQFAVASSSQQTPSSKENGTAPVKQPTSRYSRRPANANSDQQPKCVFCDVRHWPDSCTQYTTAEDRKKKASDRCIKCIRLNHPGSECVKQRRCCYCDSLQHNRAFCPVKFPSQQPTAGAVCVVNEATTPSWVAKKGCFLTCIAKVSSERAPQPYDARILIDTAGSRSMVTQQTARKLRLKPTSTFFYFTGVNDQEASHAAAIDTPIRLHTMDGNIVEIGSYIVDQLVKDVAVPDVERFKMRYPLYKDLYIPPTGTSLPIDILIGGDNLVDIVLFDRGKIVDEEHQLMATKLGWLIATRHTKISDSVKEPVLLINDDDHIKQMFDMELVGLADIEKTDYEAEQLAIDKFHNELEYELTRYDVGIPWIEETPQLSTNFGLAYGRLKSLHRKLQQQPALLIEYDRILKQQEKDDVIEKVIERYTDNLTHYIPHHPVICPEKNTKVRPVYDASAKANPNDKSLNECILKGRKWLNDLTQTLLRFRRYKIAVISDIAKAFHQIGIKKKHRDVLRFLWLRDITKPPTMDNIQIYRFKRVAFGIIASPFLLDATITYHLNQQQQTEIVQIIRSDLYADNIVTSLPQHIDPQQFYKDTKEIFKSMSMNITTWASNCTELMQAIPLEDRKDEKIQAVLGLKWDREMDELSIKKAREQRNTDEATKRNVLRKTASIFDPLGWAVPVILMAKIFLRKLWEAGAKWDEKLRNQLQEEWTEIAYYLSETSKISLPRQMFPECTETVAEYQYHAFVDASIQAIAVVVYAIKKVNADTYSSFVAARSRLAPKKQTSVPKLELIAVNIGVRFVTFVEKSLEFKGKSSKFVWSDSRCVLAWIQSTKVLPTIIQKQITQIKKFDIKEFRYIPSEMNRADVATRGGNYEELQQMKWWNTPDWLQDRNSWPQNERAESTSNEKILITEETNRVTQCRAEIPETQKIGIATLKIEDFSSLHKLLKITSICIEAIRKLVPTNKIEITEDNAYEESRKRWIRWDQQRSNRPQNMKIGNLTVFVDENGLLRCQSRIQNTKMNRNTVNPIVLIKKSCLTKLIIMHIHEMNLHCGTAHTLAVLRQNYYVPQARREIFHTITKHCYKCRRQVVQNYPPPPPAPLPAFRVNEVETPFDSVGLDIFGPFNVRLDEIKAKPKEKRWVVIFTCTTIRAIHLEVIHDMTTKEILLAFRRFISRRGTPKRIVCDNAPQFTALDRKFQDLWATFAKTDQATQYFAPRQIEWKFVPQDSPWMGGLYERLIRSVKQAMERTYGSYSLHHRQFEASILEVEAIINTRPLSYIEREPHSLILTPAHFLKLKYPALAIQTQIEKEEEIMQKLWKISQQHLAEFWQHWSETYITALRDRDDKLKGRARNSGTAPNPGDLVLLADPDKKRTQWRTAVVERRVHSADGVVRAVQIRLPNGSRTLRPVIKLAPLGINMELPEIQDNQLNTKRDAIIVDAPEGAAIQQQQLHDEELEVVELGLEDLQQ